MTRSDLSGFGPVVEDAGEGSNPPLWKALGAHVSTRDGCSGVQFAVWAPAAHEVCVVGDFNGWNGQNHSMQKRKDAGIWETFVPGLGEGDLYKYRITAQNGDVLPLKADPVGFGAQHPPETASVVRDISGYAWRDDGWMQHRDARNGTRAPISIYEVHLGSWWRDETQQGRPISYKEAADKLVSYVRDMGFTHIELLPIAEHPFDGSWGYQPVGLFAPTVRHGPPHEFRDLIDAAHQGGLGVILDWVPAHFPSDEHGLAQFDGTALYEYADPKEGFHEDWNTLIYNFARGEVGEFLISNARYWLQEYHVDGLRVDAVASMLYRDYSREDGEWVPNADGGRENYEAIDLLRRLNRALYGDYPGIMTVAEESTAFPGVTRPADAGGLGFGYKWNMGWMFDSLAYMREGPAGRKEHHHKLTFGLTYAFDENFVLSISHDEVVHGKGSMLAKMPGDRSEQFANLRAYYGFMWGHPGKKLLFMGQEFAQCGEWNHSDMLEWHALDDPAHKGVQNWVRDLNNSYREEPALHLLDCVAQGFQWLLADETETSIYGWIRKGDSGEAPVVVLCNFSPTGQQDFAIGLPWHGYWQEFLNSDATEYGGAGRLNADKIDGNGPPLHGQPASGKVTIPPFSTIMLRPVRG